MVLSLSSSLSGSLCFLPPQNPSPINSHPKPADQLSFSSAASLHLRLISSSQATSCLLPAIESKQQNPSLLAVAFPSLAFSNVLFFESPCNVEVIVGEDEPEDRLVGRFRREVLRAGVLQECRHRRFFESNQEKRKRKSRNAARRNRKWRPRPRVPQQDTAKTWKEEGYKSDEDNWDFSDVEAPCT